jgi:hypothetical protein
MNKHIEQSSSLDDEEFDDIESKNNIKTIWMILVYRGG